MNSKRWLLRGVTAITLLLVAYSAWYAYCHYSPMIRKKSTDSYSADIVNVEYRFSDINSTHLSAAQKFGISPAANREALQIKSLTKIERSDKYQVDNLTHSVPYLTTSASKLLEEIAIRFQDSLKRQGIEKHRIVVTSVLRTGDDVRRLRKVNGNASANSAHLYATTFDITYIRFDRLSLSGKSTNNRQLANVLGSVLNQLRNEGRCYVKYERKQHCFHITSRM